MQRVQLHLNHFNFFCPATGQRIIGKNEEFEPSPAMLFCYLDDIADFQFAKEFIQETYDICLEECDDDLSRAFNKMANQSLKDNSNYVCFSITTSGLACGLVSSLVHYAFDMNYIKEDE